MALSNSLKSFINASYCFLKFTGEIQSSVKNIESKYFYYGGTGCWWVYLLSLSSIWEIFKVALIKLLLNGFILKCWDVQAFDLHHMSHCTGSFNLYWFFMSYGTVHTLAWPVIITKMKTFLGTCSIVLELHCYRSYAILFTHTYIQVQSILCVQHKYLVQKSRWILEN